MTIASFGYFHVTAYDTTLAQGCNSTAPVLFTANYTTGTCYKGTPALIQGYLFGNSSCPAATSFDVPMFTDYVAIMHFYANSDCQGNPSKINKRFPGVIDPNPNPDFIAVERVGCDIDYATFGIPAKIKTFSPREGRVPDGDDLKFDGNIVNSDPKVVKVARCEGGSVTSTITSSATSTSETVQPTQTSSVTSTSETVHPTQTSSATSTSETVQPTQTSSTYPSDTVQPTPASSTYPSTGTDPILSSASGFIASLPIALFLSAVALLGM